jgi:AraC-like DNA-binding protein
VVWRARIALLASDGMTAEAIAAAVGKSLLTVRRWRRRYMAAGVASWRMQLADEMLRDGRTSVAQIAAQVGYQTESAFRRAFKRVRGVGPGHRRKARGGS